MGLGPPKVMKVPLPVIPSAARNLLVLVFIVKSGFLAALGMTGWLDDFRKTEATSNLLSRKKVTLDFVPSPSNTITNVYS